MSAPCIKQEPNYIDSDNDTTVNNGDNFKDEPLYGGWTDIWVDNEIKREKEISEDNDTSVLNEQHDVSFYNQDTIKHSIFEDESVKAPEVDEDEDWEPVKRQTSKRKRSITPKSHSKKHSKRELYQCNHCDKDFAYRSQLIAHLKSNSGEKPYQCKFCDKAYPFKGNLERHMRTHIGDKPYQCIYCDQAFTHQYILNMHQRNHVT